MNSRIILAKNIHIDKEYVNVLSYKESEMVNLCLENKIAEATDYSFIRNTNRLQTAFTYEQCLEANYIAFQNKNYSNKWFFAWIIDVNYKGERNTEITYQIDSWSTWFDYWTKKVCFINRQHVNDDTIGKNIIDEGLNVGEVIEEAESEDVAYGNTAGYYVGVLSNWEIADNSTGKELTESGKGTQYSGVTIYNNTVFGSQLFLFKIIQKSSFINLALFLARTNSDGHIADVENIFILPNLAIDESETIQHTAKFADADFVWDTIKSNLNVTKFNTTINKRHSFSDFSPKNNKCYVYPYNYLFVSNNNGSNNIFKYENFSTNNCQFENQFAITIGGSGRLVAKNYKGMETADDEALTTGKYPTCAWSSDAFTNWLTQQSVNIVSSVVSTGSNIAIGALTGGKFKTKEVAGATASVAGDVGKLIGDFYSATLAPNISGGQACGDVIWSANRNMFTFREMRAKTEYLKIIDDYFTRFGYAIKSLEMPNLTGRQYWNYLEIGASEEIGYGTVPQKYMEEINNACRKGITIWHNHTNIGNYNLDNSII